MLKKVQFFKQYSVMFDEIGVNKLQTIYVDSFKFCYWCDAMESKLNKANLHLPNITRKSECQISLLLKTNFGSYWTIDLT